MDDLELLNLAAKAAGVEYTHNSNPLNDDALALRLAVKLNLAVHHGFSAGSRGIFHLVTVWHQHQTSDDGVVERCYPEDKSAATRRAIVRAAAEIGKGME